MKLPDNATPYRAGIDLSQGLDTTYMAIDWFCANGRLMVREVREVVDPRPFLAPFGTRYIAVHPVGATP